MMTISAAHSKNLPFTQNSKSWLLHPPRKSSPSLTLFHTLAKPFLRNILKTFRGSSNKFSPARKGIYRRPKAIQSRGRHTQPFRDCQKAKEWLKKSGRLSKLTIGDQIRVHMSC